MKTKLLLSILLATAVTPVMAKSLQSLSDQELSAVSGQALLTLQYLQGTSQIDSTGTTYNQSNIGFYKLGLEAVMELNANINKLALGCGGVNNSVRASSCDIDIDNISLSGLPANANYTSDERAATSAKITNPFLQFAIKNPNSAATREVVGFRVSAEKISGLMTLGTENSATPNGINTFSGYMKTKTASGTAVTTQRTMTYADTGLEIKGKVKGTILGIPTTLDYTSDNYSLTLSSTSAPFTINSTVVSGTRLKDVVLKGSGTVGQIDFSGPLTADVLGGLLPLQKNVTGNITGLKTDITVNQNLGLIHALYLNNPASLSLQSQKILWPGAAVAANQGWWLAMEDEVELGSLSPTTQVAITNAVLKQTIAGINKDLTDNPRDCGRILGSCVFSGDLAVGNIPMNTTTLDFPLTNLTLQGQNFRSNCFGGMKFC
ncbi:hypothetical protein [Acinetobacter sp. NigerLNRRAM0016]